MSRKIIAPRGIRALHGSQPIAGLRSSGKGANRTILDRPFWLEWARNRGLSAAAGGARAPASRSGAAWHAWGGSAGSNPSPLAAALERVWNRDDSVFGGYQPP